MKPNDLLFSFVRHHLKEDISSIILKMKDQILDFDLDSAVTQIECRKKTRDKLSDFIKNEKFLFPDMISSEQASDQRVAGYHSRIIGCGNNVLDMTAGLGIDAMTIALAGNKVVAVDIDENKAKVLEYNAAVIGLDQNRLNVVNADSVNYLSELDRMPDVVFIDPARRDSENRKVYSLTDCMPNVKVFYKDYVKRGVRMLIKASPLLDLTATSRELSYVKRIYIICVKGECKEVLIDLYMDQSDSSLDSDSFVLPVYEIVDLDSDGKETCFSISAEDRESDSDIIFASESDLRPDRFLYEPNAGLMKVNCSRVLLSRFKGLKKASPNTNLYLSDIYYKDFPGRILRIVGKVSKKEFKNYKGKKFNVSVRNYPQKAEKLRNDLKVLEGSDDFIYGLRVTEKEKPCILECKRL